ncbi:disintegrin and metalloproteinase domain-containing protein 10 [Periophthalmus magnuspinnatus]|uniref:disintegrin and metalloproteinase domain-containing protein 10 n=1 Tax=Periophthalmus magnuspinnatus TaxID=409849 RepID=UPI00145AD5E9|nr:disintegrin and metalloproteinase domain-containing protein 10 [Periophthalmus magnuspinnatus]
MTFVQLLLMFCCFHDITGHFGNPLNSYIRHYEGLSYDTEVLHNSHQRAKRAVSMQDRILQLDFQAHGRQFNLRMKRDTNLFHPDLKVEVSGVEVPVDTSHIYSGHLFGERDTLSHGSVVNGRFEGFIRTHQGTYYVEPAERYLKNTNVNFHSVIYHEDDIDYPHKYSSEGGCADNSVFERMKKYQASAIEDPVKNENSVTESDYGPVILRTKRATGQVKNTCQLFIQTDHLFFKYYGSREAVIAQISSHVKAIDSIYQATDFMGIRNISFMVKRIRINTTDDERDKTNPFRFANIGVEKFLELNSEQNHDDYCLAYVFTDRDFDDGVLGLAWVGAPSGSSGGICEKSRMYSDGKRKSLNTGIITVQNYASHVPPKVSHITFAHEVGHNFGSPHDSGIECTPGELQNEKERGNYIMYARATSGDKLNNNKFSICSIRNISAVLLKKKDDCFVVSGQPICGNGLVEDGEECDCGYSDQCNDICCHSANEEEGKRCKLQEGKVCSPSQGPCCTEQCTYKDTSARCRQESECAQEGMCNGATALCPTSKPKENFTSCNSETQVCLNGVCSGSICKKYGLEMCTCAIQDGKDEAEELCHVCCMEKSTPSTCDSTGSDRWAKFFNKSTKTLQPGSPCNDYKGYCDVFMRCRLVDADGPLARLKKAIFNAQLYENIAEWIVDHWWAVLLMGIALIMLMAGFIKICSVHTPSSNPKLPPPKPLPGTLKRRRQQQQQQGQRPHHYRENYQMGQMRR